MFRTWAQELSEAIEVVAVRLPGRDNRVNELLPSEVGHLVDAVIAGVGTHLDRSYGLFGHSMGGLLAFEFARRVTRAGLAPPIHLFLAGYGAAHLYHPTSRLHVLPRHELIATLKRDGGTPQVVLDHPELLDRFIPTLRADMALCANYLYEHGNLIDTPISVFGGTEDPEVAPDDLAAWSELTTSTFRLRMLPGNHFFPTTARRDLLEAVQSDLLESAHSPPAPGPSRPGDNVDGEDRPKSGIHA